MKKILLNILFFPFRLIWFLISLPFRFLGWLFRPVVRQFRQGKIYRFLTDVPEEHSLGEAISGAVEDPMGILEHLDAFRRHLLRSLLVVALAVGISFYFTDQIIAFLAQPEPIGGLQNLQAIEVTESIGVFMRVALLAGIALATPYIAFELWLFIAPGLMPRARQIGLIAIPMALLFFISGMAFAYYAMLPTALPFLLDFLGITVKLRPSSYFEFVTSLLFWIGIAFEFPLIIFALSAMGLVQPKLLLKHWRIAVIVIAVLAAAITPTVDPVNMSLVMGPMVLLYFLSIFFGWLAIGLSQKPTEQSNQ